MQIKSWQIALAGAAIYLIFCYKDMFDLTVILSFTGLVYLLYAIIDYLGNKLFNFRIFKPRKFIREMLLVNLGFVIFILIGFIEIIAIGGTNDLTCFRDPNAHIGPFAYFFVAIVLGSFMAPWFYIPLVIFFLAVSLIVLKIYQYIFKKSRKSKIVWIMGLITAIIFISFSLGVSDYRIMLCQLKYENLGKMIINSGFVGEECVKKIAIKNNEVEICGKFGNPNECYYELGVKLNDKSICDKIKEGSEYDFYASDCYSEVALNTKDPSLCKKIYNRLRIRRCFVETADISNITKNAIKEGEPQLCVQEKDYEKMDKCYYDFVKFYYDNSDLYMDLDCHPQSYIDPKCMDDSEYCEYEKRIMCYDFLVKSSKSEEDKKYTAESFIELCDNIKNRDLYDKCYKFKKVDISEYNSSG